MYRTDEKQPLALLLSLLPYVAGTMFDSRSAHQGPAQLKPCLQARQSREPLLVAIQSRERPTTEHAQGKVPDPSTCKRNRSVVMQWIQHYSNEQSGKGCRCPPGKHHTPPGNKNLLQQRSTAATICPVPMKSNSECPNTPHEVAKGLEYRCVIAARAMHTSSCK